MTARRRVYLYARDPARIMVAARKAVGLSQRDVACRLAISPARVSRMERGAASIAASEWFYFCDLVCLDCDSISTGYSRKWYLARLSGAIERGTYKVRVPQVLRAAIRRNRRRLEVEAERTHQAIMHEYANARL